MDGKIKRCVRCLELKRVDLFVREARQKDGFRKTCRQCLRVTRKPRATWGLD